jgi:hypothetical protein
LKVSAASPIHAPGALRKGLALRLVGQQLGMRLGRDATSSAPKLYCRRLQVKRKKA